MPETVSGYNKDLKPYAHDVAKAKSLLKEAGAEGMTLQFAYPSEVSRPYMPNPQKLHEAIKNDLEEAGIKVEVTTKPWNGGYLDNVDAGKYDAWLLGWTGDYDSADNFIGTFFGNLKSNDFHTSATDFGADLSKALKDADQTVDEAERTKKYEELNQKIHDEYVPGLPISHSPPAIVVNEDVEGLVASPLTAERFSSVTVGGTDLYELTQPAALRTVRVAPHATTLFEGTVEENVAAGGADGIGPNLFGVVGGPVMHRPGFAYSDAMAKHKAEAPTWGYDQLDQFITAPARYVPGTKMSFAGIRDTQTRINLIAYLRSQGSGGFAVPAPDPARQRGHVAGGASAQPRLVPLSGGIRHHFTSAPA